MKIVPCFVLACASVLGGCTCATSHEADAGRDVGSGTDAPVAHLRDAPRDTNQDTRFPPDFDGDAGCERIHGFRVCGERCLAPCGGGDGRCSYLGICFGARGSDYGYGCDFDETGGEYCPDGRICATVSGRFMADGSDMRLIGNCIDSDFCADLPGLGLNTEQCTYSDGTRFVTGPPAASECPAGHAAFPFCGGPCGNDPCESDGEVGAACLGVSDTRAFGVCGRVNAAPCRRGDDFSRTVLEEYCPSVLTTAGFPAEPCVCLLPRPQAATRDGEFGWPVPLSVCETYRASYPGSADCVDADWNPVP